MSKILNQSLRKKSSFIKYSFSRVYDLNSISAFSKTKPQVTTYILASDFAFDLSNLQTIYLEKKIIQAAFKEQFTRESSDFYQLQTIQFVLHCLKIFQGINNNSLNQGFAKFKNTQTQLHMFFDRDDSKLRMSKCSEFSNKLSTINKKPLTTRLSPKEESYKRLQSKKQSSQQFAHQWQWQWDSFSGSHLMCASWILDKLIEQLNFSDKRSPRPVLNQFINDIRLLIRSMGTICPILGVQITITGRLGSQKKAMAQQISKCVGKVPFSTLRQNLDYSQGFVSTRFGVIGAKVWVCYRGS